MATEPTTRVLLADDDEALRRVVRKILERGGLEVVEASDGEEALRVLGEEAVDLLITDLIMPNREGLETIQACRQKHPGLPIVAISGGGRIRPDDYLALAARLGADRVLAKPFSGDDLLAAARAAMDQHRR